MCAIGPPNEVRPRPSEAARTSRTVPGCVERGPVIGGAGRSSPDDQGPVGDGFTPASVDGAAGFDRSSGSPSIVTRGIQSRKRGIHQFQSPSRVIDAGRRTLRISVASMNTATASPSPSCWMNANLRPTKTANTTTMIDAALVIMPAVTEMPLRHRGPRVETAIAGLLDPGQDEQVVVHRQPEQDREDEQRDPALDHPARRDAEWPGEPALLEDEHHDAVGGGGRQQVEQDRLDRDDDRMEGDEHQQERQAEDEPEDERDAVGVDLGDVDGERRVAGHEGTDAGQARRTPPVRPRSRTWRTIARLASSLLAAGHRERDERDLAVV